MALSLSFSNVVPFGLASCSQQDVLKRSQCYSAARSTRNLQTAGPRKPSAPPDPTAQKRAVLSWRGVRLVLMRAASETTTTGSEAPVAAHDSPEAVVFTTAGCPYCRRAKSALKEQGIQYTEVDVGKDTGVREAVAQESGRKTVPVVYVKGNLVGGADDLDKLLQEAKLDALLQGPQKSLPQSLREVLKGSKSESTTSSEPADDKPRERLAQLESIAAQMTKGVPKGSVNLGWLDKQRGVFTGKEAVRWLQENCKTDTQGALSLGQDLQSASLLHHLTFSEPFSNSEELFRLYTDQPQISPALNATTVWLKPARPANVVCEELRERVLELYEDALSADGKSVKYSKLKGNRAFQAFVEATKELQRVDLFALSRAEKMAFFINVYNALVIHAFVEQGLPNGILGRLFFYSGAKYHIGGHDYSLDDMENGVLRANRPPASSILKKRPFKSSDPRRFHACPPLDPRIHFALNCGAKSCPPVKVYTPENLESALEGAASAFCKDEVQVNEGSKTVTLSKIFDWYKQDFGLTENERLEWVSKFVSDSKSKTLLSLARSGDVTVKYSKYDWGVNE